MKEAWEAELAQMTPERRKRLGIPYVLDCFIGFHFSRNSLSLSVSLARPSLSRRFRSTEEDIKFAEAERAKGIAPDPRDYWRRQFADPPTLDPDAVRRLLLSVLDSN